MADKLSVLKYYLYYKYACKFSGREALFSWQEKKLKRHLKFVSAHSPLYKGKRKLSEYPVIDKAYMMSNFNALNTVGIDRNEAEAFAVGAERTRAFSKKLNGITVGLSSGTSGQRGIFLVSDKEKNRWAGYVLARFLDGSILGKHTIAFFMRADSNLYQAVSSKNIRFCFFDIYQDMAEHIKKLSALSPEILVGQPSVLLMLAEEQKNGALNIHPAKIISIAEVLEKEDETRIRDAFGVERIHQVYQCTEGCLATTCRFGTLHLNENVVHIEREYLDERRFVPVVTDFERKAQPIIRYRLNDILVEKKDGCPCGSPFLALERIEGREDDVFRFAAKAGGEICVFADFIRRCMLFAAEGGAQTEKCAGDYRVVQEEDGRITVYADLSEAERQRVKEEFLKLAEDQGFLLLAITFKPYEYERGRKLKRVERKERR